MQLATPSISTDDIDVNYPDNETITAFDIIHDATENGIPPVDLVHALFEHIDGYEDGRDPAFAAMMQAAADLLQAAVRSLIQADALPPG
jgi:hypothetical protein